MYTKLQKIINKHKKMTYGLIGALILLILVVFSFLGASDNKEATIVNESKTKDASSQKTKDVSKDTSTSSQEKTSQSSETEKASSTSTSASSSTSTTEDKQTSGPVYEPSTSSYTSDTNISTYEEPTSTYSEPAYEEPAASTYTPASSSNSYTEITRDDMKAHNKSVSEWDKANGFGGEGLDRVNGYLGW
ncbi:hypothetical protein QM450_08190 [Streptococcus infantis]|uniref:hypothetical protein n=1 Tax=Streptococcus infantis TaxID=68892 RepID=UPI0039C228F9